MSIEERILDNLTLLYGKQASWNTWRQIQSILASVKKDAVQFYIEHGELSQKDAFLITYGDSIHESGQAPLKTLGKFCTNYLDDSISTIHILPFFPFSSDDGFSVIDYRQVNPGLGSWDDIKRLSQRYRLMFDGVINHVSRSSSWFQSYLIDEDPYSGYFITAKEEWDLSKVVRPRTHPLLTRVTTSAGERYVWTTFSDDQIDLNYQNPTVLLEIINLLLFYVQKGARIIRLDAIAYLWKTSGTGCIHLPETHAVVKIIRGVLDLVAPEVFLITETNVPHEENISYFGEYQADAGHTDEAQMVYQFPLAPLVIHSLATGSVDHLSKWAASLESKGLFFNFLASHDGIGLLPAKGILNDIETDYLVKKTIQHGGRVSFRSNPDRSESPYELNITLFDILNDPMRPDPILDISRFLASQVIMLSLAGVPGIYIHSLFGTRNCQDCVDDSGQARSINRSKYDYPLLKRLLAVQTSRESQILQRLTHLLNIRRMHPEFHPSAEQKVICANPAVFSVLRRSKDGKQSTLCLVNVSDRLQDVQIPAESLCTIANQIWSDLIDNREYAVSDSHLSLSLNPYQYCWLHALSINDSFR